MGTGAELLCLPFRPEPLQLAKKPPTGPLKGPPVDLELGRKIEHPFRNMAGHDDALFERRRQRGGPVLLAQLRADKPLSVPRAVRTLPLDSQARRAINTLSDSMANRLGQEWNLFVGARDES